MLANVSADHYSTLSSIASVEVMSGLIMTIISLAKFIGILPSGVVEKD